MRDGKRKCPGLDIECRNDNGRPADRIARMTKALFSKVQLLQQFVVLWQVMPFHVIEQFPAAAGHLEESAAGVEVLAMRAQMLGQVIDSGSEQRDLDLTRAGVLIVDLIFGDDFGFNDCRHG